MKIMTGMGEKLSQTEVDEMVRQTECYNGDGKVKYEKFVKMMMEDQKTIFLQNNSKQYIIPSRSQLQIEYLLKLLVKLL